MHNKGKNLYFCREKLLKMKRILILILAMAVLVLPACKKTRYCKCTTIQNEEVVDLGADYYTIEDGSSCSDKSKEIVGWGQVICNEVSEEEVTGEKPSWWENLFNNNNPK